MHCKNVWSMLQHSRQDTNCLTSICSFLPSFFLPTIFLPSLLLFPSPSYLPPSLPPSFPPSSRVLPPSLPPSPLPTPGSSPSPTLSFSHTQADTFSLSALSLRLPLSLFLFHFCMPCNLLKCCPFPVIRQTPRGGPPRARPLPLSPAFCLSRSRSPPPICYTEAPVNGLH